MTEAAISTAIVGTGGGPNPLVGLGVGSGSFVASVSAAVGIGVTDVTKVTDAIGVTLIRGVEVGF